MSEDLSIKYNECRNEFYKLVGKVDELRGSL